MTLKKKPTSRQNPYIGKAGQLAVMSELALLGYNVSLPECDVGDDIFVVNDHTGELWRLQVKSATEQKERQHQVIIDEKQIQTKPKGESPDLYFVFALRRREEKRWRFLVIPREKLVGHIEERAGKLGSLTKKGKRRRTFSMSFTKSLGQLGEPWCYYLEKWEPWPYLEHDAIAAELVMGQGEAQATDETLSASYPGSIGV